MYKQTAELNFFELHNKLIIKELVITLREVFTQPIEQ